MKRFLLKLVALAAFCAVLSVAVLHFAPRDTNNYLNALLDKHALLAATPSPRILLVGGSNVAFGIDSAAIQSEFGLPVVNTGLHAGAGLKFMLDDLRPYLRRGDIVIVLPEYDFFFGDNLSGGADGTLTYLMLYTQPSDLVTLDAGQLAMAIRGFPSTLRQALTRDIRFLTGGQYDTPPTTVYRRDAFDAYGDVKAQLTTPTHTVAPVTVPLRGYNPAAIGVLNDFESYAQSRGASVYFDYPCILSCEITRTDAQTVAVKLQAGLHFPVIGAPEEYLLPADCFFDTVYHLNPQGRALRTDRLIGDLRQITALSHS